MSCPLFFDVWQDLIDYNVLNTKYSKNKICTEIHEPYLIIINKTRRYFLIMQNKGDFLYL